jgi:hypothetical protein
VLIYPITQTLRLNANNPLKTKIYTCSYKFQNYAIYLQLSYNIRKSQRKHTKPSTTITQDTRYTLETQRGENQQRGALLASEERGKYNKKHSEILTVVL